MKTFLVLAAALGFSVTAASAECSWHSQVSASVDTDTKVASVQKGDMSTTADAQTTIKKEKTEKTE
ncbi:MAG: hypothetical protein WBA88_19680 [Pseudaminobacter sp.]